MIVPAKPEHADALTKITLAAKRHWNYPEHWMQIWLPMLVILPDYISTHETWMAQVNSRPVAYYSLKQTANELWLDNLWVLPEHMGRGIGKQLFQHAIERGCSYGASVLKIEADPNAESFYKRMGAKKIDEHHGEVAGQPRILPVLEIAL
jgi:GNAT superfamily N-acetyltransferase